MPTLRLLHKFPFLLKPMKVDKGAIKFVLKGSNVMAPGLISAGGNMYEDVNADEPVAIFAEGVEHPVAIGLMKLSTA